VKTRAVNPWTWQDQFGFSQAVEASGAERVLLCAGQTSVDADGAPLHPGDMAAQTGQALDNLEAVLKQAGMGLANVVRLNFYTTDVDAFFASGAEVIGARVGTAGGPPPAGTLLGVARLAFPELMIELEATAVA
jgi:enamine deaminase RidA (YjgF/YER057c/UK114 family)